MAWTPTTPILISRAVAENLMAYFATNQADAILWANGSALRPIAKFSSSIANRAVPVFPAVSFITDDDAVDYDEDVLAAAYTVAFEFMVQSSDPDTAVTQARSYLKAFVSMIANCPQSTLVTNTGAVTGSIVLHQIQTNFEPIKTNEMQNDFLQVFQIKAIFSAIASAH